jgi:ABC-2 type transport system ATP-binding protein
MLSGLLYPTRGAATVLGHIPWKRENEYRRRFALVMGQKNQLWWDLPAHESFDLNREIYGIERRDFQKKLDELVDLLEMREKLNVMVRELSLGERMKMELIAALLHSPRVLFLDEPTIGLDVISQQKVRQFIREYNQRHRVTILLTSHYMADIEALCDRVIIIHQGKIFFDGRLAEIVNRFADSKLIQFQCADEPSTQAIERFGTVLENEGGRVRLKVQRGNVLKVCKQLLEEVPITDLNIEEIPIDDVIREIFADQSRKAARAKA